MPKRLKLRDSLHFGPPILPGRPEGRLASKRHHPEARSARTPGTSSSFRRSFGDGRIPGMLESFGAGKPRLWISKPLHNSHFCPSINFCRRFSLLPLILGSCPSGIKSLLPPINSNYALTGKQRKTSFSSTENLFLHISHIQLLFRLPHKNFLTIITEVISLNTSGHCHRYVLFKGFTIRDSHLIFVKNHSYYCLSKALASLGRPRFRFSPIGTDLASSTTTANFFSCIAIPSVCLQM